MKVAANKVIIEELTVNYNVLAPRLLIIVYVKDTRAGVRTRERGQRGHDSHMSGQ